MDKISSQNLYLFLSLLALGVGIYLILRLLRSVDHSLAWYKQPDFLSKLLGLLAGVFFRLGVSLSIGSKGSSMLEFYSILSFGFLFVSPCILGFIVSYYYEVNNKNEEKKLTFLRAIYEPWKVVTISFLIASVFGLEGIICIIMAAPLWLVLSSIGSLIGFWLSKRHKSHQGGLLCSALCLPFLVMAIEAPIEFSNEIFTVQNEILIQGKAEEVWDEIKSVKRITSNEHKVSLFTSMGFPRPLDAELIGEGIGAKRLARFEGGVLFTEVITEWEVNKKISFTIDANTEQIPATTLDEHVTIGGAHFDMLTGTYEILPVDNDKIVLKLRSKHRMRTSFNWYASLWSKAVMSSIQNNILEVIQKRVELKNKGLEK